MGQNPVYYKIDKTKGLPSNSVYDITQDKKGFMWFATDEGLCQYDGKKMTVFQNKNQSSKSGSCLVEDKYERMWYSNFDGKLFYVENNILKSFAKNKPVGYSKFGILDNFLITIESNKIAMYDIRNFELKKTIPINDKLGFISHASEEYFYAIANEKLYIISSKLEVKTVTLPSVMKLTFPFFGNTTSKLLMLSNGKVLPNGDKIEPYFYTFENNHFRKVDLPNIPKDFFQNVSSTSNNTWICTTSGTYQIDKNLLIKPEILTNFNITSVFKDNSNQYWFATNSEGILLIPNLENQFFSTSNPITQIEVSQNSLYFGTSNDQIIKSDFGCSHFETIYKGTSNHEISALKIDSENEKILFTSQKFKILSNYKNTNQEEYIAVKSVTKIDKSYYSYAATGICGLIKISDNKSDWDSYFNNLKTNPKATYHSNIKAVLSVGRGKSTTYNPHNKTIYYATSDGLFIVAKTSTKELKINKKTALFTVLKYFQNNIIGLNTNGEIYIIDSQNSISKLNYLPFTSNETANSIQIHNESLFLFTNLSVYEYSFKEKKSKKVFVINPEFEMKDLVVNNNYIYFGSSKGILKIKNEEKQNATPTKIVINEIKANEKTINITSKTILEPDENTISINFSVLNFIPNQKSEVFYKINQQNWKLIEDESRQLLLNSLSSGNYEILLKTQNNGIASKTIAISFTIKNPIWLRWWFILFMLTVFSGLIYWIYNWQIQKIEARNQLLIDKINLEKNANQSKLKAIKSQMNPHFFYNALNTLQSYILANEKKQAVTYLSKFSNLTRTILEMTEKDWVTVSEEIKALSLYLDIEKARFDTDFDYAIELDNSIESDSVKIPSILLQPYVENALKHGLLHKSGAKTIHITFQKIENELIIKIEDNGIGRRKSEELNAIKNKKHKSFATEAMQNRIELLNQTNTKKITLVYTDKMSENNIPIGTLVTLKIPIYQ